MGATTYLALERMAPIQGAPWAVPWEMHLRAYAAYVKRHGPQPALIEGWCRGGFGANELDEYIPGWRDQLPPIPELPSIIDGR